MPLTSGVFSRIWKFVDHKAAGQEVTRSDLDTALDDFVPAVNAALEMVASTTQNAAAAAASATAAASSATAAQVVEDRINLGELDAAVAATAADRVQTGLDRAATTSDSAATAADRVQTGLDRTSATSSASTATTQAGIATTQAGTATTQAGIATTQATAASSSAAAASASQTAAAASEATATTQAGIATTQAASATASATTATTQASAASASAAAAAASQSAAATARAGAETAQTGAQAARSGAEGAQTGAQAAQVGAETARDVAQAQASLSAGYAASAASVVQQDLSGVTAQALHRSPNAITAMFIYDTSKDSDGGAWTEKCQHTSWWNEDINGKWMGAVGSELMARTQGATLGANAVANPTLDANATGYTTFSGATIVSEGGRGKLTGSGTQYCGVFADFTDPASLVTNVLYELSFDLYAGTYTGAVGISADGQDPITAYASVQGGLTRYTAYIVPGVFANSSNGRRLRIRFDSAHTAGQFVFIDNVSYRRVTTLNAASGDYFQLASDGRFYRLWRNFLGMTESLSNSYWSKTLNGLFNSGGTGSRTVTDAYAAAHDGQMIASRVQESAANDVQGIIPATGVSSTLPGLDHVFTIDLKADTRTQAFVGHIWESGVTGVGQGSWIVIDLTTGTQVAKKGGLGNADSSLVSCVSLGNGWWRATVRLINTTNAALLRPVFGPASGGVGVYLGDGTSGILVARPHVQIGTTEAVYEKKTVADGRVAETFRGNKRDFPRVAGIVAEAGNVTIYDLTEPGRPMFARFVSGSNTTFALGWANSGATVGSLAALNGKLFIGSTSGNNVLADFAGDDVRLAYSGTVGHFLRNRQIANRNSIGGIFLTGGDGIGIASFQVNAVAMTVLTDAPVDPVTSLRVPTIAVATGGGISIIKHNGVVVSSANTGNFAAVTISAQLLTSFSGFNHYYVNAPGSLSASWTISQVNGGTTDFSRNTPSLLRAAGRSELMRSAASVPMFMRMRNFESTPVKSLFSTITQSSNTGWVTGDIRRCFLSDVDAGSIVGPATVADRSYKAASATATGTLTKAALASGTSLVGFSGFSAANYLQEPYSADLDFGVAEWTGSAWVNVPAALPLANFPVIGAEIVPNGTFDDGTGWTLNAGITIGGGTLNFASAAGGNGASITIPAMSQNRSYRATFTVSGYSGGTIFLRVTRPGQADTTFTINANGSYSYDFVSGFAGQTLAILIASGNGGAATASIDNLSIKETAVAPIFDRAHLSGSRIRLGITALGNLTAEAFDGTTTRTVTSSAAYNTATWLKARVNYTTDGSLTLLVNGREVASTRGTPLLTLNNASAVLTIGNSYDLAAPFPGSIALLKLGATVPTSEQAIFMFEQEKQMFRAGALSVLPDAGALVDMAYDDATDRWVAISAANESYWTGLVRNSVQAVPAGSFSRVVAGSGLELAARTTTNPGVDVTIPAYGLREELVRRSEAAARLSREIAVLDFVGGFTANTTNGSTAITSVAGLTYPTSYIGARISGAGIPANTTITAVSGTTIYLSAAATATATGVSISFLDFALPAGLEAKAVLSAGALRQEGSTKDFTRLFDGFRESIRFAVAPGATAWVQIQAARAAQ